MSGMQRFTQVDAFADRPFAGNPAAVCLLPSPADPEWMQQVAREMNLAETAFLVRRGGGLGLRRVSPTRAGGPRRRPPAGRAPGLGGGGASQAGGSPPLPSPHGGLSAPPP